MTSSSGRCHGEDPAGLRGTGMGFPCPEMICFLKLGLGCQLECFGLWVQHMGLSKGASSPFAP